MRRMSIINDKAVLLLGAGVSAPFGVPLGDKIIGMIADSLGKEITLLRKSGVESHTIRAAINETSTFWHLPIHATAHYPIYAGTVTGDPAGRAQRTVKLAKLRELLTDQ